MKKIFLVIIMISFGISIGFAQKEKNEVIYVKFTSVSSPIDGKVYKQVNSLNDIDAEPAVSFILEDMGRGYTISIMHIRHKREEVTKIRQFIPDRDSMERFSVKGNQIKGTVIDLDTEIANWTKEDGWAFEKKIKQAKKVYFIDKRDTKDGVYLMRQVKFISSNNPQTDVIIVTDEEIIKELQKSKNKNLFESDLFIKLRDSLNREK